MNFYTSHCVSYIAHVDTGVLCDKVWHLTPFLLQISKTNVKSLHNYWLTQNFCITCYKLLNVLETFLLLHLEIFNFRDLCKNNQIFFYIMQEQKKTFLRWLMYDGRFLYVWYLHYQNCSMLKSCINNLRLWVCMCACEHVFLACVDECMCGCVKIEAYIHKIPILPEFSGLMLFRSRLLT